MHKEFLTEKNHDTAYQSTTVNGHKEIKKFPSKKKTGIQDEVELEEQNKSGANNLATE